jgi:hypothetical protein
VIYRVNSGTDIDLTSLGPSFDEFADIQVRLPERQELRPRKIFCYDNDGGYVWTLDLAVPHGEDPAFSDRELAELLNNDVPRGATRGTASGSAFRSIRHGPITTPATTTSTTTRRHGTERPTQESGVPQPDPRRDGWRCFASPSWAGEVPQSNAADEAAIVLGGRGDEPVTVLLPFAIADDRAWFTGGAVTRARA